MQKERNWLVEQLQNIAHTQRLRISFLSGDVHCAGVGVFKTMKPKNGAEVPITNDFRYMVNVITSWSFNSTRIRRLWLITLARCYCKYSSVCAILGRTKFELILVQASTSHDNGLLPCNQGTQIPALH